MTQPRVIAIDGPAASGKSSTAAAVAQVFGFVHIDSGALYRALTWVAVRGGIDDAGAIVARAEVLHVGWQIAARTLRVHIDGIDDAESAIRTAEVNAGVSAVAAMPAVREWVNGRLREAITASGAAVVDGRDIGTVVVPEALLKVYLTATAETRAKRRLAQQRREVTPSRLAIETATLVERDRLDTSRREAPLRPARDAIEIDTTGLTFEQQVRRITLLASARGLRASS